MKVRRCVQLFLEPREVVEFDLAGLFSGGAGARHRLEWVAHAPHLDAPVVLDDDMRIHLGTLSPERWVAVDALADWPDGVLARLLEHGLVLADSGSAYVFVEADAKVRAGHWWGPAAMVHRAARWRGQDAAAATEAAGLSNAEGLRSKLGAPPPAVRERCTAEQRHALPLPATDGAFDVLLQRRTTCRNFDPERMVSGEMFAAMMHRVFAAQASWQMDGDTVFLKKGSPSGGGLHPTEAYVIVQRVEGTAPGLYHYHPLEHALEPLDPPAMALADLARLVVAGQYWFADAPVIVVMAARFERCFWKYRKHAKAYRAITMDAGHLSQTLYLSATELGLGAFVTCAVNEIDIEQAFGLDPMTEGVMAVSGFGWRADTMETAEFDPQCRTWRAAASAPAAG
ncbi:putative peptide maturation dehydrogenase [Xanthomonas sp. XNM01]|uniref:putative peptide maturation dehydrogenase n=1 Tax=Xanthomonas sp. XNM01 TaxID=2769289 RepID=UPI0017832A34|nr:putative peptide maturation dehydrogenase [Xanthomonas sp. XNM01]